jgi:hypothetical protein
MIRRMGSGHAVVSHVTGTVISRHRRKADATATANAVRVLTEVGRRAALKGGSK